MKIKDVISEGFFSSFGKALLPSALQKVADVGKPKAEYNELELAKAAYEKFGPAPGFSEKVYTALKNNPKTYNKAVEQGIASWLKKEKPHKDDSKIIAKALSQKAKDAIMPAASPEPAATATQTPTRPIPTATNIPQGQRIVVTNPQRTATFYKYPDGKWTDEFGSLMPKGSHQSLNQFADVAGRMEQIPTATKTAYQGRKARRGR